MLRRALGSLFVCAFAALAFGQDDPELKPGLADDHAAWVQRGVLKVIAPAVVDGETFTDSYELIDVRKIPGIDYTPNFEPKSQTVFEKAKQVSLRRSVWALEFSFKPVRMLAVDVPQPEGKMKKRLVWYLVYRVRNLGGHLEPLAEPGQSATLRDRLAANELDDAGKALAAKEGEVFKVFKTKTVDSLPKDAFPQVVFFPTIVLQSHDYDKEYLDRVIPAALPEISKRERVGKPLHDAVTISRQKIEVSTADKDNSVWGVATWEGVDPRIDFFSVSVQGLTNAYVFQDKAIDFKLGDPPGKGRTYKQKTLVLHFWRPGDTIALDEKEVKYGMPVESDPNAQKAMNAKYGERDRLDYRWVYR